MSRIVILTEGQSNPTDAKTATGVLHYRADEVVAMLDSALVGTTAGEQLGVGGDIPFIASVADVDADTLLIGIAPAGGGFPEGWRSLLRDAIERGMSIVSGLHAFIGDDPEFRDLAVERGVTIHDVRKPPKGLPVSRNVARHTPCFRVHTVGHDCSVGKMLTSLEITRVLKARGHKAEFVATGQTGIMISGKGYPIDAVVSDFVAGAAESLVVENQESDFVVVEGQGSLIHPLFSGVTLGLLHGCAPQAMVMCIVPGRTSIKHSNAPMRPLPEVIDLYERLANVIAPSSVVAVSLNTFSLSDAEAAAEIESARVLTGLPATDVIRFGCDPIVDAILEARVAHRDSAETGAASS
jgi:uncharacterized NAD-dependent epimerase/dehydratase family protein